MFEFESLKVGSTQRAAVMLSNLGVDTHYLDPLANLALTTRGQAALFLALDEIASRWLALGGGGIILGLYRVPGRWRLPAWRN